MLALCCYSPWKRDRHVISPHRHRFPHSPTTHSEAVGSSIALQQLTVQPLTIHSGSIQHQPQIYSPAETFQTVGPIDEEPLNDDDNDVVATPKRNNSALEAVKTKLIRHLSFERSSSNHISIGTSEEEISRRAELRQIRNRRIQDELSSDDMHCISAHTSIRSTKYLSPYIDIGMPGHGPRDTIEFSMDNASCQPSQLCPPPVPSPASGLGAETSVSSTQKKRRSSCPSAFKTPQNATSPKKCEPCRDTEKDVSRPQSVYCSSSARLGMMTSSSPQMERVLGRGGDSFSSARESHSGDNTSGLGMWLIAQAWHGGDSCLHPSTENDSVQANRIPMSITPPQDFGGIDSIVEKPCSVRKKDSIFRRKRRSSVGGPSKTQPSTGNSHISTQQESNKNGTSSPTEKGSSCYPSGMPSFQPSPAHSQSYINVLSSHDLESLELSPFEWHDRLSIFKDPGASDDRSSYNTAEESFSTSQENLTSPTVVHLPVTREPNASPCQSETASYYQREAELRTIPKRFIGIFSHPKQPQDYKSRFKETFEVALPSKSHCHSFMTRLANEMHAKSNREKTKARNLSLNGPSALSDFISGTLPVEYGTVDDLAIGNHQVREHFLPSFKATSYQKHCVVASDGDEHQHTPKSALKKLSEYAGQNRYITPIESWAKYPSHTRIARSQHAGQRDKVSSRDFAVKRVFYDGRIQWSTDQNQLVLGSRTGPRAATFPIRISSAVRSGISKLRTIRDETSNIDGIKTDQRPSCVSDTESTPGFAVLENVATPSREALFGHPETPVQRNSSPIRVANIISRRESRTAEGSINALQNSSTTLQKTPKTKLKYPPSFACDIS